MNQSAAIVYAIVIAFVIIFQCCLIAGAPWGKFTQGGTYSGKLPPNRRWLILPSILILLFMVGGITSAAELTPNWPSWSGWAALALQLLATVLNWSTPSKPERLLWGPITTVMLALAIYVVVLS